jgi:transmembrane sensor
MRLRQQIDSLQTQLASQWLEVLRQRRPEDLEAFDAWCRESPLHIREFLEIMHVEHALDEHAFGDSEQADELLSLLKDAAATRLLPQLGVARTPQATPVPAVRVWSRAMAAAVAIVIVGGGIVLWAPWRAQEFSTKIGEQRIVELVDTSVVTLNTDSDVRVDFDRDARNVELLRGEAMFKVAHDAKKPFQVHTKAGTVRAIGTQFNVYDRPDFTEVSVMEGRVRLIARSEASDSSAPPEMLGAGEAARIGMDGVIRRVTRPDVERATSWSKRRLKFDNASLEDMVAEFNRYQRDTRLRIEGVAPGSHHYSGIFDPDAPEAFGRFLAREPDLTVERSDEGIVIRSRSRAESDSAQP